MLATTLKHEALKEKLLEDVTSLPAGAKLPTVKELMARYGVSQATMGRVLGYLKDNGYVRAKVGSGIYVAKSNAAADCEDCLKKVDLIYFGKQDSLTGSAFHLGCNQALSHQLGLCHGWLRSTVLPIRCSLSEFINHVETLDSKALILMNLFNVDIYDAVCRRLMPFVLLFPNTAVELSNSVIIDNRSVAGHWVKHLYSLGHRKIAYLMNGSEEIYQRDQTQRLRFFYEEMGQRGIAVDPDLVVQPEATAESGYQAAVELLKRGKDFSAIVCGDPEAVGIYKALKEKGLRIGKDVSLIGMDDLPGAEHMTPGLTTIRVDREKLAGDVISVLRRSANSENRLCASTQIATQLVERNSTGPAGYESEIKQLGEVLL